MAISTLEAKPATTGERSEELAGLQEELDSIKVQIEFLDIKVKDSRASVRKLEDKIAKQKGKVKGLQERMEAAASESYSLNEAIEKLQVETEKSKTNYETVLNRFRARLVDIHKIKQGTLLESVFSAKDLNSFLNRFQMVRYLLLRDRSLLDELQQARTALAANVETLREKQVRLGELAESIKRNQDDLNLEASSLSAMLQTLLMEKKLFVKRQENLKKNQTQLEDEISRIEGLRGKNPQEFDSTLDTPVTPGKPPIRTAKVETASNTAPKQVLEPGVTVAPVTSGRFQWPVKKIKDLGLKPGGLPPKSLDIKSVAGAEVFAVAAGKVMFKGPVGNFGNLIILGHKNGFTSVYGNLADQWVGLGQPVEPGELIGQLGEANQSTLHFEIRLAGTNQDPLTLLPKIP